MGAGSALGPGSALAAGDTGAVGAGFAAVGAGWVGDAGGDAVPDGRSVDFGVEGAGTCAGAVSALGLVPSGLAGASAFGAGGAGAWTAGGDEGREIGGAGAGGDVGAAPFA